MVSAVRCPNPKCQKYMLVEPDDRGKVVPCLICKQPIKVPAPSTVPIPTAKLLPPDTAAEALEDLNPL
jgi:hypothetical protein